MLIKLKLLSIATTTIYRFSQPPVSSHTIYINLVQIFNEKFPIIKHHMSMCVRRIVTFVFPEKLFKIQKEIYNNAVIFKY